MHFFQPHSIPFVDESTLCSQNGIHTLTNVVIFDSTHVDLFPQSCNIQGLVDSNATQAKKKSYHNQHSSNQFFLLAIEVFVCVHK
jgi:hypothetical protein